jgi:hypothetical protein
MTEQPLLPPPDPEPEAPVTAPSRPRRDLVPWFYGLGFLVLAAAVFYLWQYPGVPGEPARDASALQGVEQRLADVDARLNRLEQRPAPDLSPLSGRVDALDSRIADQSRLASRLDALSGRIESLSGRNQSGIDATKQQIDALTARVAALEANASNIEAVTNRLNRIARLQEASLALSSGRAIGDWPEAPAALARFSHTAPPTEADLRLRFPHAEQAALSANQTGESNAPFIDRVWDRAQGLITIRRGNDVVVGNPASVILSRAQAALDAGDLAGAITAIETLKGQPEQAMADWLADAKAIEEARAALAQMAAQA